MSVTYTDCELRNLVEEYITQQKSGFTLKGVCSYILYWAVEDGRTAEGKKLIESDVLSYEEQVRVRQVLEEIVEDGRIAANNGETYRKL